MDLSRKRVLTGKALEELEAVADGGFVLGVVAIGDKP
jgi:hypothetical protein